MFRVGITIMILFVGMNLSAQNLVPNPSFEEYNLCPQKLSEILFSKNYSNFKTVKSWASPVATTTPDYYNVCASAGGKVGIPQNVNGYQNARTGKGYVGIIAHMRINITWAEYSEYIYCKLNEKLKAGVEYEVSFYVCGANVPDKLVDYGAIDRIGAYFSDTIVYEYPIQILSLDYSIKSPRGIYLDDTTNWMLVSGTYTAKGGEEYMYLGNFYDTSFFSIKRYGTGGGFTGVQCYYFVDDVSVEKVSPCDTHYSKRDTMLCTNDSISISSSVAGANSYIWNTGITTKTISINNTGTYWCKAQKDSCDLYIDTIIVGSFADTISVNRNVFICLYDSLNTIQSSVLNANSYLWQDSSTASSIVIKDTGVYTCTIKKGCFVFEEKIVVNHPSFDVSLDLGNDTILCKGIEIRLGSPTTGLAIKDYRWNTGSKECCIIPTQTGNYILTVSDGCTKRSDSIHMVFDECVDCIIIPSAFSPNGDGRNDILRAFSRCAISNYDFKVFNRWGELVYQTNDIAQGWDGLYNGQDAELGTYFYQVRYKRNEHTNPDVIKGDVLLVR